jgi:hypothetical protein
VINPLVAEAVAPLIVDDRSVILEADTTRFPAESNTILEVNNSSASTSAKSPVDESSRVPFNLVKSLFNIERLALSASIREVSPDTALPERTVPLGLSFRVLVRVVILCDNKLVLSELDSMSDLSRSCADEVATNPVTESTRDPFNSVKSLFNDARPFAESKTEDVKLDIALALIRVPSGLSFREFVRSVILCDIELEVSELALMSALMRCWADADTTVPVTLSVSRPSSAVKSLFNDARPFAESKTEDVKLASALPVRAIPVALSIREF